MKAFAQQTVSNVSMTTFMVFSNRRDFPEPTVKITDQPLAFTRNIKFLGVEIDNRLLFADHISTVCSRVSRTQGVMRRLAQIVPKSVLRSIYCGLVYPHLTYGVEVWGDGSKTALTRLRGLVGGCVKLMANVEGDAFEHQVYNYFMLVRTYKYVKLNLSEHFQTQYNQLTVAHDLDTRFKSNENFNLPHIRTSKYSCSFLANSVRFWNNIPIDLKNAPNLLKFKKLLRRYLS